jgi:hypothetical protein
MILEALGLAAGSVHVALDRLVVAPGEAVTGTLRLVLAEPVHARRLVVGLTARQRAVGLQPGQRGLQLSYRNDKVYDVQVELSGERDYAPGETVKFSLLVPRDAKQRDFRPPGGLLGDVVQALSFLSNVKRFPLEWKVHATLERPWALNARGEAAFQLGDYARDDEATPLEGHALKPAVKKKRAIKKTPTTRRAKKAAPKSKKRPAKKPRRRGSD